MLSAVGEKIMRRRRRAEDMRQGFGRGKGGGGRVEEGGLSKNEGGAKDRGQGKIVEET